MTEQNNQKTEETLLQEQRKEASEKVKNWSKWKKEAIDQEIGSFKKERHENDTPKKLCT